MDGNAQTEVIKGPAAATVTGRLQFSADISVTPMQILLEIFQLVLKEQIL